MGLGYLYCRPWPVGLCAQRGARRMYKGAVGRLLRAHGAHLSAADGPARLCGKQRARVCLLIGRLLLLLVLLLILGVRLLGVLAAEHELLVRGGRVGDLDEVGRLLLHRVGGRRREGGVGLLQAVAEVDGTPLLALLRRVRDGAGPPEGAQDAHGVLLADGVGEARRPRVELLLERVVVGDVLVLLRLVGVVRVLALLALLAVATVVTARVLLLVLLRVGLLRDGDDGVQGVLLDGVEELLLLLLLLLLGVGVLLLLRLLLRRQ